MTAPITPQAVVAIMLNAPATNLVPKAGLPSTEVAFLSQWSPGAVASTIPRAVVATFSPAYVASQLTPTGLTQAAVQGLATAAVLAVLV